MTETLCGLLADHPADAPAIGAPDRPWLTHGGLAALGAEVGASLAALGLGRGDRVAIVLPNGPEMAAAFVTLAQRVTTAPLNPAYREEEFDFYLGDLDAKALLVAAGDEGPAVEVARRRGMALLRLAVDPSWPAGRFTLAAEADDPAPRPKPVETGGAEDGALVLHTSGTTSRPKIVPLLQRNLAASARHIAATLDLTPADRCLNVMPLFHIHGLLAAVLASLSAGASVWCAPGFNALQVFGWLKTAAPTWYTAVPTMHQAILARAGRNREILDGLGLRFIRSSSAPLPAPVMMALADTFGCPVVESYGMTEAAHQMTSNPIAPGTQRPGSVGRPAGPAVRLADEAADRLLDAADPEATGEVVIAGPNVTPGYEANPDANARSFFQDGGQRWFRTGDQGRFDGDGYLTITGRLKEIINRGGEKISPIEVDSVLLTHPQVAQAVTFAVPHDKLGEEVGAAVVAAPGAALEAAALRDFAAERLADFKVPRRVVIVEEIPKGATGKLQRIGLAAKLGLA